MMARRGPGRDQALLFETAVLPFIFGEYWISSTGRLFSGSERYRSQSSRCLPFQDDFLGAMVGY